MQSNLHYCVRSGWFAAFATDLPTISGIAAWTLYIWAMCGRIRLSSDYSEIKTAVKFDLDAPAPNFEADWNKPPTAPMLVAIQQV